MFWVISWLGVVTSRSRRLLPGNLMVPARRGVTVCCFQSTSMRVVYIFSSNSQQEREWVYFPKCWAIETNFPLLILFRPQWWWCWPSSSAGCPTTSAGTSLLRWTTTTQPCWARTSTWPPWCSATSALPSTLSSTTSCHGSTGLQPNASSCCTRGKDKPTSARDSSVWSTTSPPWMKAWLGSEGPRHTLCSVFKGLRLRLLYCLP